MQDWDYAPAEYAWHQAELELVMRRPDTPQLIATLIDLINSEALSIDDVNEVLDADGVGRPQVFPVLGRNVSMTLKHLVS